MPYQCIWRHPQILPSLILVETGVCVGASTLILVPVGPTAIYPHLE